ncbi:conserved exported hypothetical protein [uncultured Paludibacter sp.]|nr:conserved exported hypothetical protein [uncultured Paludibacter sp.]
MKKLILFFLFSTLCFPMFSLHPLVRNFSRTNYKSGTQNWDITQSDSKLMYFANNSGLLEFDGKNWNTIPIRNYTNVRSVLYTPDGKIYAGAFNEFGYYTPSSTGELQYYSLLNKLDKRYTNFNEIWNIHSTGKDIYFQADRFIFKYNGDTIIALPFDEKIDVSAYVNNVLLVANSKGVFMLNGNMSVRLPNVEILAGKKVCSILPYQNGELLIVTRYNGVYLFNGSTISVFNTGIDDFLKNNQVFCALSNGKQIIYGTVQKGIAIQDIHTKTTMFLNTYSGLQNNTILSMAFDSYQNLWLGLDKGIDYVLLNSPFLEIFDANNLYGAGYTSFLKGNTLFLGTNQGLYKTSYPLTSSQNPLQLEIIKGLEGQIWCLNEIDNTLFCGADRGTFIVSPSGAVEQLPSLQGTWAFKTLKKHPDMILGCSYQGLFILKKTSGKWNFSHFIKGDFKESSGMFEEDIDGSIWFSHWQKGLFRLTLNNNADSITQVELFGTDKGFPTNQNNIVYIIQNELLFSSVYGFYQFNRQEKRMESAKKWNDLFISPPNSIRFHQGRNDELWCASGSFLGLASKKNGSYKVDSFSFRMLQPKLIVGFENFNFVSDKDVIVSTEDGFSLINTNKTTPDDEKLFNVIIKNVIATGQKDSLISGRVFKQVSNNPFKIAHKLNSLRFEFISPEYRKEGLVQYSYILENYDKSWSNFSDGTIKEYTQLPKGNYIFKVRAKNLIEPNVATAEYSFTILPAWYESTFATIIYFLLAIAALLWLIKFVKNKSEEGAKEMEQKKELEMKEQEKRFEEDTNAKKKEITELKNQKLQYELRHKSQELANSTMNLIRKNEMLLELNNEIEKLNQAVGSKDFEEINKKLNGMQKHIKENIKHDNDWRVFQENFDIVYDNYLKRLCEKYPNLSGTDRKICAYLKMNLSSKDMAPLLNMTVRSIEMNRYRIRQKMNLDRDTNLAEYLQRF